MSELKTAVRPDISPDYAAAERDQPASAQSLTIRAILLSLGLAAFFGYVIPIIDYLARNTYLGGAHLPPGAVGVLLLLLALNPALKLVGRRFAFTRAEVLTVYITCLFSCLIPGHGGENYFVSSVLGSFYHASPENKWLEFLQVLPQWFSPALQNPEAAIGWYEGAGAAVPWNAWIAPLLMWGVLIAALYTMLGCLGVILRAQWAEKEALTFPLLKLPAAMVEYMDGKSNGARTPFFANRVMWIGFALAVVIQLLNGLNRYFPDVPPVPLSIPTGPLLTEAPWNQIGRVDLRVLPMITGVSFLLSAEISLSLWAFYWLMKLQLVAAYAMGFVPAAMPGAFGLAGKTSLLAYERLGAVIAYVALVLWIGRAHFLHIAKRAFGRTPSTPAEREEPLSYPVAFWGFVISFGVILGWSTLSGMSTLFALALWLTYLIFALALTRLIVEGGLIFVQPGILPANVLGQLFGSGPGTWMTQSTIVPASFVQYSVMTDMRGFLLPSFVQGFKLARDHNIKMRPLMALISACIIIAFCVGIWMNVRLGYTHGGTNLEPWFGQGGKDVVAGSAANLIKGAPDQSISNWLWMGVGGALTTAMMAMRAQFLWFPLHPVGFILSLHYPIDVQQFSIFLGWLTKVVITKFGGHEAYRALVPTALGLILGDVTMMLFWLVIAWWQGTTGFQLMPA